jgi:hypothetical protein
MRGNGGLAACPELWRPSPAEVDGYTVPITITGPGPRPRVKYKGRAPLLCMSPVPDAIAAIVVFICFGLVVYVCVVYNHLLVFRDPILVTRCSQFAVRSRGNCRHRGLIPGRYLDTPNSHREPTQYTFHTPIIAATLEPTTPRENRRQVLYEDQRRSQWPCSRSPPQLGHGVKRRQVPRAPSLRMRSSILSICTSTTPLLGACCVQ